MGFADKGNYMTVNLFAYRGSHRKTVRGEGEALWSRAWCCVVLGVELLCAVTKGGLGDAGKIKSMLVVK